MQASCLDPRRSHHEAVTEPRFPLTTEEIRGLIGAGAPARHIREIAHRFGSLEAYRAADTMARGALPLYTPRPLGLGGWSWAIGPADEHWPARLDRLAEPPVLLFGHGDPACLGRRGLAVTGSRAPTRLGARTAVLAAEAIIRAGGTVLVGPDATCGPAGGDPTALGAEAVALAQCLDRHGTPVLVLDADPSTWTGRTPDGNGATDAGTRRADSIAAVVAAGGAVVTAARPGQDSTPATRAAGAQLTVRLAGGVIVCDGDPSTGPTQLLRAALSHACPILAPRPRPHALDTPGTGIPTALTDPRGTTPERLGLVSIDRALLAGLTPVANGVAEDPASLAVLIEVCLRLAGTP